MAHMRKILWAGALLFFFSYAFVVLRALDNPQIPEADQAAYWKELATFHYLDAQLQATLKAASQLDQQKAAQQVKVNAAKAKLEAACPLSQQLDPAKFAQGIFVCVKPKEK